MHKLGNVRTLGAFFSKNIAMHVTSVTTQMPLQRSAIGALYTAPLNSNLLTPSQGVQLMTSSALTLPEKTFAPDESSSMAHCPHNVSRKSLY